MSLLNERLNRRKKRTLKALFTDKETGAKHEVNVFGTLSETLRKVGEAHPTWKFVTSRKDCDA